MVKHVYRTPIIQNQPWHQYFLCSGVLVNSCIGYNNILRYMKKNRQHICLSVFCSRSGTRTRVSTVRGWRANRYTNRPLCVSFPFDTAKLIHFVADSKFFRLNFQPIFPLPRSSHSHFAHLQALNVSIFLK